MHQIYIITVCVPHKFQFVHPVGHQGNTDGSFRKRHVFYDEKIADLPVKQAGTKRLSSRCEA